MDANQLRSAFTGYFAARGHEVVPSASLIPHDPTVMFTIAGMVPFKPYFVGEEQAPWRRATSVQKCFRTIDIDIVGTTTRHCTFFEMLGNFSFGDYFKEEAIFFAWEFVTESLGIDGDRLWATVYETDDEAVALWADHVGLERQRIQRMGDDNFWKMGDTGPCGPSSELYFDKGEAFGDGGGPAVGGEERYVEIWNLVFMQNNRLPDGTLEDLPRKNIDTGAGLERILPILQGTDGVFDTDAFAPILETARSLTKHRPSQADDRRSAEVSFRIMADHGRAMTMLVADGVAPSNEGRGYVLRRLIRRAVLAARRLDVQQPVTAALVASAASVMGDAYPAVLRELSTIQSVVETEEANFDRTLRSGLNLLETEIEQARSRGASQLAGEVAFRLHDTHGFPIELTEELASEGGLGVDMVSFEAAMAAQRGRAREAARRAPKADDAAYRKILDAEGPTSFVGRDPAFYTTPARIVGVLPGVDKDMVEVFLDRTPFYAEGGGQVGDSGSIVTETGRAEVFDTVVAVPGLFSHRAKVTGEIFTGQDALATIEAGRREALRRNHTATHLLHGALRTVLGDHVHQQGSLVEPGRLRFDFSHPKPVAHDELVEILELANDDVISDDEVVTTQTTRKEAEQMGALSFFKDRYGDTVRVVRAGPHSIELCGGTHVSALGSVGPIAITTEGSIGSNTRRVEATTGLVTVRRSLEQEAVLNDAAQLLRTEPDGVLEALQRVLDRQRSAEREVARLRAAMVEAEAGDLAASANDGVLVARRDGTSEELRSMAQVIRSRGDLRAVVLVGVAGDQKVAVVVATDGQINAVDLARRVAHTVGGGGGGSAELAVAGGRAPERVDEALAEARRALSVR